MSDDVYLVLIDRDKMPKEIEVDGLLGPFPSDTAAMEFINRYGGEYIPNWGPWWAVETVRLESPTPESMRKLFQPEEVAAERVAVADQLELARIILQFGLDEALERWRREFGTSDMTDGDVDSAAQRYRKEIGDTEILP